MTNHELLLAISALLDVKLKAELQPQKNECAMKSGQSGKHAESPKTNAAAPQSPLPHKSCDNTLLHF